MSMATADRTYADDKQRLERNAKIRSLFAQGYDRDMLAVRFGLNLSQVGKILRDGQ